jgi:hypothetical protein
MPFSRIFQLYRGGHYYWWRKPEDPGKTIDVMSQMYDKTSLLRQENLNSDGKKS